MVKPVVTQNSTTVAPTVLIGAPAAAQPAIRSAARPAARSRIDRRSKIAGGGDPDGFAGGVGVLPRGINPRSKIAAGGDPDGFAGRAGVLPRGINPRLIACLAAVYLIWSSTYLAMRIAVAELPPLYMAGFRYTVAGLVMLAIARRRGAAWPSAAEWLRVVPAGAL